MIFSNERFPGVSGAHIDTIFLVWIYNNTNRRVLAVLLFHGVGNLTGEIMGFSPEMYPFILFGYAVAAVLIVAV